MRKGIAVSLGAVLMLTVVLTSCRQPAMDWWLKAADGQAFAWGLFARITANIILNPPGLGYLELLTIVGAVGLAIVLLEPQDEPPQH